MAHRGKGGKGHYKPPNPKDDALEGILNELWELDDNKCYHGDDFEVDLQSYATTKNDYDKSRRNLFCYFNDSVFERPTYKAFKALLDNYTLECGEAEVVTPEEKKENRDFIESVMRTKVMQRARSWLIQSGKLSHNNYQPLSEQDIEDGKLDFNFMRMLYRMWFNLYRRTRGDRDLDSSSFEHVFIGEEKNGQIVGLHNWLHFYLEEKAGRIDYHGFFGFKTDQQDSSFRLLTLKFDMVDDEDEDVGGIKKMSSLFLGTSPEFELATYTVLKLNENFGKTPCQLGEYEVMLECFPFAEEGVGTAFIGANL